MNLSLSILIPVRDEEQNIRIISEEIKQKIDCSNYEIVFINDFSKDQTEDELIKLSQANDKVVYYNNSKKGLGGALDLGIQKSKGKYICIMMSDSSDTVEDLNLYYNEISSNNYDAIFGSRFIKGAKLVNYPKVKLILNRLGNLFAKLIIWTDLNDFTNGFKIYKKETLLSLYPLVSESFNIFLELPLKTIIRGFNYKIIPISYYNRTVGEAKFKIDELGSKYIFTLLYCFLEKILLNTKVK
jgi:dolichol-phosphate mannosyltransferase